MIQGNLVSKLNVDMTSNNERKVFREMFTNGGHTLGACFVFLNEL